MRLELLYNPRLLCERLAEISLQRRRLGKLRVTPARTLLAGHVDSLELLELLRAKPPAVVYDIGANAGTWTVLAKAIFRDSEVHAFEPLGRLKEEFSRRTQGLAKIHHHAIALGEGSASMPMKLADFIDASSLLDMMSAQTEVYNTRPGGETIVPVEALDSYVQNWNLPPPDLIKLDVQGYEDRVLRGAAQALKSARAIITEVSFIEFYRDQCLFHDLVCLLARHGFHVRAFAVNTRLAVRLHQTDVLFEKVG